MTGPLMFLFLFLGVMSNTLKVCNLPYGFIAIETFFIYFRLFNHTFQILQQIGMWKNVHPVDGAGIRTHDLWNMSLLP